MMAGLAGRPMAAGGGARKAGALALVLSLACVQAALAQPDPRLANPAVADELFVVFDTQQATLAGGATIAAATAMAALHTAAVTLSDGSTAVAAVPTRPGELLSTAIARYSRLPGVKRVTANMWVHSISLSGADAGGAGGTQRRALQEASDLGGFSGLPYTYPWRWPDYETFMADPATSWAFLATSIGWAWGKGANGTQTSRVCLIDSGVDHSHPELKGRVTKAVSFVDGKAVDGLAAGFDEWGHGTAIAGVIASQQDGFGIVGMLYNGVSLYNCKFIGADGFGKVSDALKCLDWCWANNVNISVNAWGANVGSTKLTGSGIGAAFGAVDAFLLKAGERHLFITAAGNQGRELREQPEPGLTDKPFFWLPAQLKQKNMVVVAAQDKYDEVWRETGATDGGGVDGSVGGNTSFVGSNYGPGWVHIGAPGLLIVSPRARTKEEVAAGKRMYREVTGTSIATAFVAGTAGLLQGQAKLTESSRWNMQRVREAVLSGADVLPQLKDKVDGARRLNAYNALADFCGPSTSTICNVPILLPRLPTDKCGRKGSSSGGQVLVRVRPLSDQERRDGRKAAVQADGRDGQVATAPQVRSSSEGDKSFTFDRVFGPESRQEDVYDAAAAALVEAALQGFNATVFAYGQTGCGKTHTMEGREQPAEERGIIPRAFDHIFREIQKGGCQHVPGAGRWALLARAGLGRAGGREYLVRVSHLEIYNEEVRDLLSRDAGARLELRESPERGVHVKGLKEFVVKSAAEMASVLEVGAKNRTVGATLMNQDSSRSHSIFTIIVESVDKGGGGAAAAATGGDASPSKPGSSSGGGIRVGKLNLVDLAGSERQAKTGATGDRLKEASKINLSLSALGNVISALTAEGAAAGGHVPYRDSKLTRLLQDSLGGNSKTVMIANVGPADYNYEETLSTLRYANRAKNIKNKPRVNEDPKAGGVQKGVPDAMLREFQEEIARLKSQLAERQQARVASANPSRNGSPEKPSSLGSTLNSSGGSSSGGGTAGVDARAAAIRQAMRAELQRQLRQAANVEALAKARQAIEQQARQRLEAELASTTASLEERQHAASLLAAQQAELQAYAAEVEQEQAERLALEQRIRTMESKVLRGGKNLIDEVEKLEAAAAAGAEALAQQRAAQAAAQARIAALEAAASEAEGRHSSVQEEAAAKRARLQRLAAATAAARQEAGSLAAQCQAERERLLDDIRRLTTQMQQKDLIIGACIPPEYQQLILSRCRWEEGAQRWAVDHLQWAGNLVRARRDNSLSGSETGASSGENTARSAFGANASSSSGFGEADGSAFRGGSAVLHGDSDRLANVFFSYSAVTDALAPPSPAGRRPSSAAPPGSPLAGGRPRTAALAARQSLQRPISALGRAWG
ncbi:kinesin-ii motor [Micractinium conductrix]|uniref:Kinesin-ii motor n=1 Tax=Micractinium conductrix TaxID=554055 RepID=A0A2P6V7T4_9CHLO|nr:kinesin-ii motor [Micractinium conductrix]|eukprot:PSC70144.1 kinesin-ii motor [Micractinium conductrix]